MTVSRLHVDFQNQPITHSYPHVHSNQWLSGVRVAYADLSLVRRPSINREEWAANVMAFYQQMGTLPYFVAAQKSCNSDPAISDSPPPTVPAGFSEKAGLKKCFPEMGHFWKSLL